MVPFIPYTADELLEMDEESLRAVRGSFFRNLSREKKPPEVLQAIADFMVLLSMVQDLRAWGRLAEPGMAAMVMELGPEWEDEIEPAREMDRLSIAEHADIAQRFREAGGREALAAALKRVNSFATP